MTPVVYVDAVLMYHLCTGKRSQQGQKGHSPGPQNIAQRKTGDIPAKVPLATMADKSLPGDETTRLPLLNSFSLEKNASILSNLGFKSLYNLLNGRLEKTMLGSKWQRKMACLAMITAHV